MAPATAGGERGETTDGRAAESTPLSGAVTIAGGADATGAGAGAGGAAAALASRAAAGGGDGSITRTGSIAADTTGGGGGTTEGVGVTISGGGVCDGTTCSGFGGSEGAESGGTGFGRGVIGGGAGAACVDRRRSFQSLMDSNAISSPRTVKTAAPKTCFHHATKRPCERSGRQYVRDSDNTTQRYITHTYISGSIRCSAVNTPRHQNAASGGATAYLWSTTKPIHDARKQHKGGKRARTKRSVPETSHPAREAMCTAIPQNSRQYAGSRHTIVWQPVHTTHHLRTFQIPREVLTKN